MSQPNKDLTQNFIIKKADVPSAQNQEPEEFPVLQDKGQTSKKKKIIIFSVIFSIILILALGLGLGLGLRSSDSGGSNRPDLITTRGFQAYDTFEYTKLTQSCVDSLDFVYKNTKYCENSTAVVAFHVVNVTSSKDLFPSESNEFTVYGVYAHLKNLTVSNASNSISIGGADFTNDTNTTQKEKRILFLRNKRLLQTSDETDNNTTANYDEFPVFKVDLFDNGTIWRIFKPLNITEKEKSSLIEVIKEFSPQLAKKLYNPRTQSISLSNSGSSNETSNNYQESYGSVFADPSFIASQTDDKLYLHKTVDKSNLLDISLPETSDYYSKIIYIINTDTGHLQTVLSNGSSYFNQGKMNASHDDEDPNYFAGEKLIKTNYTSDNKIPNPYSRAFSVNSSSALDLTSYQKNDQIYSKNLNSISSSINFEELPLNNSNNSSNFVRRGNMSKGDSIEMFDKSSSRGRKLFEKDVTTIDDFKNKYIVYPLSKTDLWGFQLSIELFLQWKPNQNVLSSEFYLYEERTGFFIDLCHTKLNIPLAQTNHELVNFLYHSYFQIKDLSEQVKTLFDSKLFTNVTYLLTNVDEAIKFPFNIPQLFEQAYSSQMPNLINQIETLIEQTNVFITNDDDHIFKNPLDDYTAFIEDTLKDDVKIFLSLFDSATLLNFGQNLQYSLLSLNQSIQNANALFPDVVKELQSLESELKTKLVGMNNTLTVDVAQNFKREFSSLIDNLTSQMTQSYSNYSDAIRNSGYSKGLNSGLSYVYANSAGSVNNVILWLYKIESDFLAEFNNELKPDFLNSNMLCINTLNDLSNLVDNISNFALSKTVLKDEIIPYDNAFDNWGAIMQNFQDFRYHNFNQLYDFPMILNETVKDSLDYLENFYENYEDIERKIGNFSAHLRTRVDELIYSGTESIKDFDLQMTSLLAEDTSEVKVLYTYLLKLALASFPTNLNNLFNDTLTTLDGIFEKLLQTAIDTMNVKNDKIILCDQEAAYLYTISDTFASYITNLEAKITANLQSYLFAIQQRIVPSLKISDLCKVSNDFYALNNIIFGDSDLFNSKVIQNDYIDKIYVLFDDTRKDLNGEFQANLTQLFDQFKAKLNNKIIANINEKLPLYTESFACDSRPIIPTNPNPNSFCVLYSLTMNEINSQPLRNPKPIRSLCTLYDTTRDAIYSLSQRNIFSNITSPSLDVLINSQIIKFTNQSTTLINEILNATNLIKAVQNETFRDLEDRLEDLIDKEKYAWSNYLLQNMSTIIDLLSNYGNQALRLIVKDYGDVVGQIGDYVKNTAEIKDFVAADLANLLATIQNDGNYFVTYFQQQAYWGLTGSIDRVMMVHQKNNEFLVNFYNYTYVDYLVPKALGKTFNNYLVVHQQELQQIYNESTDIRNAMVNHLNTLLAIRYQDFKYDFANLIQKLTVTVNQVTFKRENVNKNIPTSFQLNAYEEINYAASINELTQTPLINFDDSVMNSGVDIANLLVDKTFELLPGRFEEFHQILNNSDAILNEVIREEVKKLLDESLNNIFYFFSTDSLLKAKFQELAIEYHTVAKAGLLSFATEFEKEMKEWQDTTYSGTMELLQLDDYCVNDKILNQYEKFQQYILSELTTVYTTNLPDLQDIFFHILSQLKVLVKGTIYNSTMSAMFDLTNGVPTILTTNNGETISILDLISDFKDQYKLGMNDAINFALQNIYNDSAYLLEELTSILEDVYTKTENDLLTNLTALSEKMTIFNEDYDSDRMGIDFGNYTPAIPGQDGHFSISYFDFLVNQTKNYEESISLLDLSNLTQLEKFRNLKRYLDVDFPISVMNSNLITANVKLVKKIQDYNQIAAKLNYQWEAEILATLFETGFDSLELPLKQMLLSQQAISNLNQTNIILLADLVKYAQNNLNWIANYVNGLSINLGTSTPEILIQLENTRNLYINNLPQIFTSKIHNFDDGINQKIDELVDKIAANFHNDLLVLNLNDFDNDNEKKALLEVIDEIKVSSPILNWKNKDASDLALSIIIPLTIIINNSANNLMVSVNQTWDNAFNNLKTSLTTSSASTYGPKRQLYKILLDSIQKIRSFAPLTFNISNSLNINISNITVNFTRKVQNVITEFQQHIQPLSKVINDSLDNLESSIKTDSIIPILNNTVYPPVLNLAETLQKLCSELLNEIGDTINEVMAEPTPNSNLSRRLLSHISYTTVAITGLQDIMNIFSHSLSDSVDQINNLPIVNDIQKSVREFVASLDQNNFIISTYLDQNMDNFTHTMDSKTIAVLRTSILDRLTAINNFARNAISLTYQNITAAVQSFYMFDWEVVEIELINLLYQNRDNLTERVLNEVEPLLNISQSGSCLLENYFSIQLPIPGVDVLNFGFDVTGLVTYRLDAGVDRNLKTIYVNYYPGIEVDLEGHSRMTLMSADYDAFIRGTLVQAMLTFKAYYHLIEMRSYQTLCLNLDFGSLTVGVDARYRHCRRHCCWFHWHCRTRCGHWGNWQNIYSAQIVPFVSYFGCLNLEQRD